MATVRLEALTVEGGRCQPASISPRGDLLELLDRAAETRIELGRRLARSRSSAVRRMRSESRRKPACGLAPAETRLQPLHQVGNAAGAIIFRFGQSLGKRVDGLHLARRQIKGSLFKRLFLGRLFLNQEAGDGIVLG